jgi:hypothetical protein
MIVAARLGFFSDHAHLAKSPMLRSLSGATAQAEWVVYAKRPFGGREAVLAYQSRYTHRVAIANSRLIAFDQQGVTKGEQNCPPEIPQKPRDARPSRMSKGRPTGDELSRNEALSPDLIICL